MTLPDLRGRTAVITGASRGIGAALAVEFASHGMNLGLCARSQPALAPSGSVVSARLDITDEQGVADFERAVADRFGDIDLWINNAGVLDPIAKLRDVSVTDFRRHIDINLTGVFIGARTYIRHLRARHSTGVLLNISSGAAWHGYRGWGAYCAGKSGVERLTECISLEEGEAGLRAHAVAPGVVDTDMQTRIRSCSAERFPDVADFIALEQDDGFNSGEYVARELLAIAFDPDRVPEDVAVRLEDEE